MRICMIVRSRVKLDSRVLRIGDALAAAGHDVVCAGYATDAEGPAWLVDEVDGSSLAGWARKQHAALLPLARIPGAWRAAYWTDHRVQRLYDKVLAHRPDVVHAHDWDTLPIAVRVAAETGCNFVYDAHEFAREDYVDSRSYRLLYTPFTRAVESACIGRATAVVTVSPSIANELQRVYSLPELPTVVRNIPDTERYDPRPRGEGVRVIYHGGVTRHRGLVEAATSAHDWPAGYHLTIRGDCADDLRAQIMAVADPARVTMVPAVRPERVVAEANAFDVGLHPSVGTAKNDEWSLPNKFFEYMGAGLALCIAELPEMAALIRRHDLGTLIARPVTPATISAAITELTPERIDRAKQACADLAKELTWRNEAATLVALYDRRLAG